MEARHRDKRSVGGYLKLFRQMKDWEWYTDVPTKALWLHILLSVSWGVQKYRGVMILPGQMLTSVRKLSKETGLSEREVRTALEHLKATHEVTQQSTHQGSLITVEKWHLYQVDEGETDTLSDTLFDTVPTHIKEY